MATTWSSPAFCTHWIYESDPFTEAEAHHGAFHRSGSLFRISTYWHYLSFIKTNHTPIGMAHQGQAAPSVVMSHGGVRQQVPLRDYLNSRIAPFLKKAMTQSLGVEAEYPLQWLGEYLINQSILYEGNPDSTRIKEKFLYDFDSPVPVVEAEEPRADKPEPENHTQQYQSQINGDIPSAALEPSPEVQMSSASPVAGPPNSLPNGEDVKVDVEGKEEPHTSAEPATQDTEMAGTS